MAQRTKTRRTFRVSAVGAAAAVLLLAGCGDSDDAGDSGDENSIDVSLSEWSVEATGSASAGSVVVNATNDGGETHELVVVRADSADGWTQDETGFVQEDQFAEGDLIGEIEEFDAGTTESATFELDAGSYVLFCNIVEEEADGTYESHFNNGMVTTIEVS